MAKSKTVFYCTNCGHESSKWMGQCPGCKEWNTFEEGLNVKAANKSMKVSGSLQYKESKPVALSQVKTEENPRMVTGVQELDRVLGGGIVDGGLILVGGDPGIGKSTLLLQICRRISSLNKKILYISGEESLQQIKLRAKRLKVEGDKTLLYTQTDMGIIEQTIIKEQPDVLMIDSIQTMYSNQLTSVPGSVSHHLSLFPHQNQQYYYH
jgi:DNA repair protein RadA/Sms